MRLYHSAHMRELFGYSDQHLRRLEKDGYLPKRFKKNPCGPWNGAVAWDADAVDAYIEGLKDVTPTPMPKELIERQRKARLENKAAREQTAA
jgi:predicted DNA-binding transcriptional regulator AlpA